MFQLNRTFYEFKAVLLSVEGDIGVCGIRELFMQYFGNSNLKFRYSHNLRDSVFQHFGSFWSVLKTIFFVVLPC